MPSGSIILWSGHISNIPEGFALCDGSNGTPDLRSRFVVGAGADTGVYSAGVNGTGIGYYKPGDIGGEDRHQLTIAEIPRHNHTTGQSLGSGFSNAGSEYSAFKDGPWRQGGGSGYTGGDGDHENRPPFYALAYIFKL